MPRPEPRGSHEGAITSRQRLSYKSRSKEKTQLSRESREKAQVESWSQGEPGRSLSESQETQGARTEAGGQSLEAGVYM